MPLPSGSALSSVIDNVFPTVADPVIEKDASPSSSVSAFTLILTGNSVSL